LLARQIYPSRKIAVGRCVHQLIDLFAPGPLMLRFGIQRAGQGGDIGVDGGGEFAKFEDAELKLGPKREDL
jgi:hypothetical protein